MKANKFWCFFGVHELKIIAQGPYEVKDDWGNRKYGAWYSQECTCCGHIKYRKCV